MSQKGRMSSLKTCQQLCCVATLAMMTWGCSGSGYDQPVGTENAPVAEAATSVLIEPATLKGWMDQGLVNGDGVFDQKVVVLDYGSFTMDTATDPERLAGALRVNNGELASSRIEGLALASPMVATGAQMDAVIQRLGINENTTIVFTTAGAAYFPTRAYWMFRYWGFPQEKLKMLDGGNAAFSAAYPDLMTRAEVEPAVSTYSVKDVGDGLNDDLRLSMGEMLGVVAGFDAASDVILDARGPNNYAGLASSPGYVTGRVDLTVYDGHPEGAQYLTWKDVYRDAAVGDYSFKSKAELEALFAAKGWSTDKTTTVYCLSGYSATPLYFAVEAILGAPARLYDGSWSQFGQYSDNGAMKGELPSGSPWASDKYLAADEGYRYNYEYVFAYDEVDGAGNLLAPQPANPFEASKSVDLTVETLKLDSEAIAAMSGPFTGDVAADDSDVVPSQVEAADAAYVGSATPLSFPTQEASIPAGVLISAAQLKTLIDAPSSLVNAPLGGERVVILDATDDFDFVRTGHIPGAQLWDIAEHVETRVEGPAPAVNMVLSGAKMDAMLQKHGIDDNTTIVISSSKTANYFPSRAYFLLRYYGFPKERLKVLDGYNGAWTTAGHALSTSSPAVVTSDFSVQDIANLQPDTRVSLAELMDAARDGRGVAIDFRGDKSAAGSTPGVYPERDMITDYVAFEGVINGAGAFGFGNFTDDATGLFKPAATIEADLAAALGALNLNAFRVGDYSNSIYSYCRTGYIASTGFFVLDAILGVDVMAYDGSWSQWGKMSADASKGGQLPAGSSWATDGADYMSTVNYNLGNSKTYKQKIESLVPVQGLLDMGLFPSDADANQIESADAAFKAPVGGAPAAGPPTPFTPAGGGC